VLTIVDLGILRDVKINDEHIEVIITPTYSGCPAMDMIAMNIKLALLEHGYKNIIITSVLSPAWTTDWMSEAGKQKLKAYGIAPPNPYIKLFAIPNCLPNPKLSSAHYVIHTIQNSSASLAQHPAKLCTNARIAASHLIILNVINFIAETMASRIF
jgi:phenylacetate-CoA oxygenase PaaJ subunit